MDLIKFENFNFSYSPNEKIFSELNLTIKRGDFVLFCGPSGCGKTTLIMNLKNEIRPIGEEEGIIYYDGENIREIDKEKSAREIGFLFQNPENQFVSDTVIQEISFSLENMGVSTEEIRTRIAEMSTFFGLDKILYKKIDELSGGQKQLVNLCSLLILKPKALLLDEPTSQLDPIASYDFLAMLRRLNEEFSMTILMTEHRINNVFPFIDQAVFIENGEIKYNNSPQNICLETWNNDIFSNYLPATALVHFLFKNYYSFIKNKTIPISIRDGLNSMYDMNEEIGVKTDNTFYDEYLRLKKNENIKNNENIEDNKTIENNEVKSNESNDYSVFECKDLWFGYEKNNLVIKDISFKIIKGEFISILGGNGTGKSTLLQLLAKILKPIKGKLKIDKEIQLAYVHQNPMIHFRHETVAEELKIDIESHDKYLENRDIDNSNFNNNTKDINDTNDILSDKIKLINFFEIETLLEKHPYDCSSGEQQKIVIMKALLKKPDILFLDEPTKGLDPMFKKNLGEKFKELQKNGLSIVMVTHDIDFAADYTDRSFLIFDGNIQVDSTPKELFYSNNFYTTFVNRMVKNYIPKCITLNDLKKIWNKNIEKI
ncbi:Trehalose/maltose import ATP-binding protein MalK [Candidatus Methanobinarius endosymbioticus]|uniref:Trehalose/maltose import ATP-binding protein MalK n=1 Tax=Candidatus Methanobinarius endosymbioticus TaxID=2006182 RepID=A0A366M9U9_9EURY|nr:Trehalose/maltose import ATP-binding protein MalK [Candidatus Methanobinarius endosymbioticus]